MSNFNEEVVNEVNSLRTNPKRYANKVAKYCDYFKGKILKLPGSNAGIRTDEGADAYREAADFLSKQSRIEAFEPSKGLMKIAEEFLAEVQRCDPNDLGSIDMESIIGKYGSFSGNFSRAMDFGGETPEQVLTNLIVSDGDPSRGQRESLLSTDLKKIGVANGRHDTYRHCTVIVTCTKFDNTVDDDDRETFGNDEQEEEPRPKPRKNQGYDDNEEQGDGEGKTLKPRKVVLRPDPNKQKAGKKAPPKQEDDDGIDDELPPGVLKVNRAEKIIVENGRKKKIVKITRFMEDGTKEIETCKEPVEDEDEY